MTLIEAHLGDGAFAPLQLAPATISGILYALRAHHLEGTSRAVSASPKAPWCCSPNARTLRNCATAG